MKAYLDTSVLLRKLLGEPESVKPWPAWDAAFTSEIARVESLRTLDRLRLQGDMDDAETAEKRQLLSELFEELDIVALGPAVLDRASQSFPTVVGTLDAIHLASALLYRERLKEAFVFITHDRRLATAARACGLETPGAAR